MEMPGCVLGQGIPAGHPPLVLQGTALEKNMEGAAHTDVDLVSSLVEKISLLEQKIEKQAQEMQLKDRRIAELQERIKTLQEGEDAFGSSTTEELEMRCLQLQSQVWEMERFLSDYGLIWVGETREQLEDTESAQGEEELSPRNLCRPGEGVVCRAQIDFDLILENIKDLNALVGEGISQIEHTPRGARLRRPEPLPLTLYRNGMVVGHGAFRPYQHPGTQQCLQDIMDGYFPSELQPRYPDGVPLQVTDRRDVVFQKPDLPRTFPGLGQVVGTSESNQVQETSEIPGPKSSSEQDPSELSKPPKHRGRVGSAQGVAGAASQGSDGQQSSKEILVETPGLAALERCRVKAAEGAAAPGPDFCSLRVRSESGEHTYELRLLLSATIGDLRQHLAHIRGGNSDSYEIISTFPQRVYTDNSRSLQECGLVPSASLLLRRRDPSQKTA
ncbi:PREDICTED: UBX domain-containing protein 11 [Sturnus vulgaris]|uniref:UBX domain-containing protein 11 n=1 Tax=Sturnus vulgaris TaxID=9172 RepID=UPI00071A0BED|nr:PREDICTED: UBX domain-containing protein 11 [Sturnus vulgaris]